MFINYIFVWERGWGYWKRFFIKGGRGSKKWHTYCTMVTNEQPQLNGLYKI